MKLTALTNNEAAILGRIVEPDQPTLSTAAAKAVLAWELNPADRERADELAAKARAGTLTDAEQAEVEAYSRIGSLIGIFKSKARQTLRKHSESLTAH